MLLLEQHFFKDGQSKAVPVRSDIMPLKIMKNPLKVKVHWKNWFVKYHVKCGMMIWATDPYIQTYLPMKLVNLLKLHFTEW
jgi:hypothetical protein